jgi:hypothetical protein
VERAINESFQAPDNQRPSSFLKMTTMGRDQLQGI